MMTKRTVPHDESNRMYQEILEWVAEGNTITMRVVSNGIHR